MGAAGGISSQLNPAGTVPTLIEENGLVIADSGVICEYLEEAYPDTPLMGHTLGERVEVRRLVAWFDGKFAFEVTRCLLGEKFMKRLSGRGNPDAAMLRGGYAALRAHLEYVGHLAETRKWLARRGAVACGFRRRRAISRRSISWATSTGRWRRPRSEWYARIKSRPSFRPLLADRVPGVTPPHYADLDF